MAWLANNWIWIVGGLIVLVAVVVFVRSRRSGRGGSGDLDLDEMERAALVRALIDALEGVIEEAIGTRYGRKDRQKIAIGMVAVMAGEDISLEQLRSDKKLFVAVMLKSMTMLWEQGIIAEP